MTQKSWLRQIFCMSWLFLSQHLSIFLFPGSQTISRTRCPTDGIFGKEIFDLFRFRPGRCPVHGTIKFFFPDFFLFLCQDLGIPVFYLQFRIQKRQHINPLYRIHTFSKIICHIICRQGLLEPENPSIRGTYIIPNPAVNSSLRERILQSSRIRL